MVITQSLIKQIYHKDEEIPHCPFKIKAIFIDKVESPTTQCQLEGNFFETLCLGSGSKGRVVNDLPRIRQSKKQIESNEHGRKTAKQQRIEFQVEIFKRLCNDYEINVDKSNIQTTLSKKLNNEFELQGDLDIFPTNIRGSKGKKIAIIDLKLTSNINNEYGNFCWGTPERMDDIQGITYQFLAREYIKENIDYIDWDIDRGNIDVWLDNNLVFLYWVFDSKPVPENKFILSKWNENKKKNLEDM